MPEWISNVNFLQWLINNGVGVAFSILLLFGLVREVRDAVKYFTNKLDIMVQGQQTISDKLIDHLDQLNISSAKNNEALSIIMTFMSQNMAQIVAHRQSIEGENAPNIVPGPMINTAGEHQATNGGKQQSSEIPKDK